jgi:hypothetical protein
VAWICHRPDASVHLPVPTKALNQAVQRNIDRFPGDFMFQLNVTEFED